LKAGYERSDLQLETVPSAGEQFEENAMQPSVNSDSSNPEHVGAQSTVWIQTQQTCDLRIAHQVHASGIYDGLYGEAFDLHTDKYARRSVLFSSRPIRKRTGTMSERAAVVEAKHQRTLSTPS
jgi:hypothetical protein